MAGTGAVLRYVLATGFALAGPGSSHSYVQPKCSVVSVDKSCRTIRFSMPKLKGDRRWNLKLARNLQTNTLQTSAQCWRTAPKSVVLRKALMITTIGKKDITADHSGTRRRAHILSGTVPAVAIPSCLHQIPLDP